MINKIQNLINKYHDLSEQMINPDITSDINRYTKIAKEHKSLEHIVKKGEKYFFIINF